MFLKWFVQVHQLNNWCTETEIMLFDPLLIQQIFTDYLLYVRNVTGILLYITHIANK